MDDKFIKMVRCRIIRQLGKSLSYSASLAISCYLLAKSLSLLLRAIRHLSLSFLFIRLEIEVEDWADVMAALHVDPNRYIALKAISSLRK